MKQEDAQHAQTTPFRARTPQRFNLTEAPLRPIMSLEPRRPEFFPNHEGIITAIVVLDEPPALNHQRGMAFSRQVINIKQQQQSFIDILTAEPYNAVLIGRITLSANALIISVDASWLEAIATLPGVLSIQQDRPMRLGG
ncbi:MAG: hypothetical protein Kow00117_04640 [Phototrophicales bacterium]